MLSHLVQRYEKYILASIGKIASTYFQRPTNTPFFVKFKKSYTFSVNKGIFLKLDCPQCQAVIVTCTPT